VLKQTHLKSKPPRVGAQQQRTTSAIGGGFLMEAYNKRVISEEECMPYKSTNELPESVKSVLPEHAQAIYKEAFNSAYEEYKDKEDRRDDASREETAHKVAWAAVKKSYHKGSDEKWHAM
jgi:cation transport regulator